MKEQMDIQKVQHKLGGLGISELKEVQDWLTRVINDRIGPDQETVERIRQWNETEDRVRVALTKVHENDEDDCSTPLDAIVDAVVEMILDHESEEVALRWKVVPMSKYEHGDFPLGDRLA